MANFCVATRMKPSDFWELTLDEYNAIVEVLNRRDS